LTNIFTVSLGSGVHNDGEFKLTDIESFRISEDIEEPAVGLFHGTQNRRLIFRTMFPVLTESECKEVINLVENHIKESGSVWGSVRSASLPTTDVAVEDIPMLDKWLRCLLATVIQPLIACCFPVLSDGSNLGTRGERLRVHDGRFILR
jgi:hypothetical protein